MTWISFVLWALLAGPVAGDAAVDIAVLVHDPATDRAAALRLSDRERVPDEEIDDDDRSLVVRLVGSIPTQRTATGSRGFATGEERAVAMLAALAPNWNDARVSVAAAIAGTSAGVFEGIDCEACTAVQRGSVAVIGIGIDDGAAMAIAASVGAVGGDPVERLLALAEHADEMWPRRHGPASATLVAAGPSRAREFVAVDRHGRVGRRLLERHLRHLADVELPFELQRAKEAWADGDEVALAVHRRRALTAGRRALEAFPRDSVLQQRMRAAENLRPEHDVSTP